MKKTVAIIGGGPAALALAAFLDSNLFETTIYEKNKALGRKFLVAGKGGFNLTHSESIESFIERYTPSDFLKNALLHFDNQQFREWLHLIGIPTFIGSSKRVYPIKGIKPIEVLAAIKAVLNKKKVSIKYQHQWTGWTKNNRLVFNNKSTIKTDYTIFALGGASWKVTGSDGNWLDLFSRKGVSTTPFQASNCAYKINWPSEFIKNHGGKPLKNIAIQCQKKLQKGEAVITQFGLEGNAIYALSPPIRTQLKHTGTANIYIDLKPDLNQADIFKRIEQSSLKMTATLKQHIKLNTAAISLLKTHLTKEHFLNPKLLSQYIKHFPLSIHATAPIDEAISTVGGINLAAIQSNYELKNTKNHFCIGEMLNWDAPTGGYLLQACFSMGAYLAQYLNTTHQILLQDAS